MTQPPKDYSKVLQQMVDRYHELEKEKINIRTLAIKVLAVQRNYPMNKNEGKFFEYCNSLFTYGEDPTTVTINRKEYDALKLRDSLLTALEKGGVDNWEWYGESTKEYYKNELEDEEEISESDYNKTIRAKETY